MNRYFESEGYDVIRDFFTHEQIDSLVQGLISSRDTRYREAGVEDTEENKFRFNDGMIPKSYSEYFPSFTESVLKDTLPRIEEHIGLTLFPVSTYARMYYNGATMYKHRDREACEISLTFPIKQGDDPWPIWLKSDDGTSVKVILQLGDILVYRGSDLFHWREAFNGNEQWQIMLHYVDANGPVSHRKFDNNISRFLK